MKRSGPKTRLTEEFTYNNPTEDYSTGDLVLTEGTTIRVYCQIKDVQTENTTFEDKLLDRQTKHFMCRRDSVVDINNGTEITLDNGDVYTVSDKFDHKYEWMTTLVAHRIDN